MEGRPGTSRDLPTRAERFFQPQPSFLNLNLASSQPQFVAAASRQRLTGQGVLNDALTVVALDDNNPATEPPIFITGSHIRHCGLLSSFLPSSTSFFLNVLLQGTSQGEGRTPSISSWDRALFFLRIRVVPGLCCCQGLGCAEFNPRKAEERWTSSCLSVHRVAHLMAGKLPVYWQDQGQLYPISRSAAQRGPYCTARF